MPQMILRGSERMNRYRPHLRFQFLKHDFKRDRLLLEILQSQRSGCFGDTRRKVNFMKALDEAYFSVSSESMGG